MVFLRGHIQSLYIFRMAVLQWFSILFASINAEKLILCFYNYRLYFGIKLWDVVTGLRYTRKVLRQNTTSWMMVAICWITKMWRLCWDGMWYLMQVIWQWHKVMENTEWNSHPVIIRVDFRKHTWYNHRNSVCDYCFVAFCGFFVGLQISIYFECIGASVSAKQ